jgi:hypothetical protein
MGPCWRIQGRIGAYRGPESARQRRRRSISCGQGTPLPWTLAGSVPIRPSMCGVSQQPCRRWPDQPDAQLAVERHVGWSGDPDLPLPPTSTTGTSLPRAETTRRYQLKNRLRSPLVRRFDDEHLIVRPGDDCHAVVEELSPTPAPGSGSGSTSRRRPARREDGRAAATGGRVKPLRASGLGLVGLCVDSQGSLHAPLAFVSQGLVPGIGIRIDVYPDWNRRSRHAQPGAREERPWQRRDVRGIYRLIRHRIHPCPVGFGALLRSRVAHGSRLS